MRLRKTKASRSADAPEERARLKVSGSIRSPDESDALEVTLRLWDGEFVMSADNVELGSWPSSEVHVAPIDSTSFELLAEGDRLIFTPDNPATFAASPFVAPPPATTKRSRRRSPKKTTLNESAPQPGKAAPTTKPKRRRSLKRSWRKGSPIAATAEPTESPKRRKPKKQWNSTTASTPEPGGKRHGMWIRTLDTARHYPIFSLDRVPVDESFRGKDHQHTWDHRAARPSGPGNHICTICGKIRIRTAKSG